MAVIVEHGMSMREAMEVLLRGETLFKMDDGIAVVPDVIMEDCCPPSEALFMCHVEGRGGGGYLNGFDVKAVEAKDYDSLLRDYLPFGGNGDGRVGCAVHELYPANGSCSLSAPAFLPAYRIEELCEEVSRGGGEWTGEADGLLSFIIPEYAAAGDWARSPEDSWDRADGFVFSVRERHDEARRLPPRPDDFRFPMSSAAESVAGCLKEWCRLSCAPPPELGQACRVARVSLLFAFDEACLRAACSYLAGCMDGVCAYARRAAASKVAGDSLDWRGAVEEFLRTSAQPEPPTEFWDWSDRNSMEDAFVGGLSMALAEERPAEFLDYLALEVGGDWLTTISVHEDRLVSAALADTPYGPCGLNEASLQGALEAAAAQMAEGLMRGLRAEDYLGGGARSLRAEARACAAASAAPPAQGAGAPRRGPAR